ncbi:MAG: EpsG family protein [Bacteroidales bacterium]|nr:EpsG family protein [Bacteroidales bacterium]
MSLSLIGFSVLYFTYNGSHLECDWNVYRFFWSIADELGNSYFEKGFDFLLVLANKIGSFEIVIAFTIFTFGLLIFDIKKYLLVNDLDFFIIVMSLFMGFLPLYFGALRQTISSSLIFISLIFILQDKYKIGLIYAIISILFHKSAILQYMIVLVAYFMFKMITKKDLKQLFIILTFGIIAAYLLVAYFIDDIFIQMNMAHRLGNTDNVTSNETKDVFILAERLFFVLMCLVVLSKVRNKKSLKAKLALLDISGCIFYILTYSYARNVAGRTLAFYRYLDFYLLYEGMCVCLPYLMNSMTGIRYTSPVSVRIEKNSLALTISIFYACIKYYVTVWSIKHF